MIVRDEGTTFLLITQPDHAQLAEHIVAAVRTEASLLGASRASILLATREHDNGWIEVDAEPTVDPDTGRPTDFVSGPAHVKHDLWPRGITRVARLDPRAGALVAEHALTVYGYRRQEPRWTSFFDTIAALRDGLLDDVGAANGEARGVFAAEYRSVRLGDSLSLQFCHGWGERHATLGYEAVMEGDTLVVTPDPFGGAVVPLRIVGRRIPARRYRDDSDLRAALATARRDAVSGVAKGRG